MRDKSHTDYYQYSWSVLLEKEATLVEKLVFAGVIIGMMVGAIGGSWWLNKRLGLRTYEFFGVLVFFEVSIIGVIGYFWNKLLLNNRYDVRRYRIDREGLEIQGKRYMFDEINKTKTLELIAKDKGEKEKKKNEKKFMVLVIVGDFGTKELEFVNLEMKKKVKKALRHNLEK